jgi:hypothetical protein
MRAGGRLLVNPPILVNDPLNAKGPSKGQRRGEVSDPQDRLGRQGSGEHASAPLFDDVWCNAIVAGTPLAHPHQGPGTRR